MIWLVSCAVVLILALAVGQALIVGAYLYRFYSFPDTVGEDSSPKAAIILAVRGMDPFLNATLMGLLDQDYPDYTIFVIVDSHTDPAWKQLRALEDEPGAERIVAQVVRVPRMTCSLKCGALAQAVSELDPSYEVVAFIDGDAPPHPTWLSELVAPLRDARVGVATGNRWYAPRDGQWGSLVRYFWNTGAVVQVWLNGIIWAGSMAMRASVIRETELVTTWQSSLSVDGTVCRQMKRNGYRVQFVPRVMMINEEETELSSFMRWVERQLVAARTAENGWLLIWLHALNLLGSQVLLLASLAWALWNGVPGIAAVSAGGLLAYWISSLSCVMLLEQAVYRGRGKPFRWLTMRSLWRTFPAFLLTHVVYPVAMVLALRQKRISWRGVEYEVLGLHNVRLLEYRPFQAKSDQALTESTV